MATGTARPGNRKGTKKKADPAKKRKARGSSPASQSLLLQKVLTENPTITSDEYAIKFQIPIDEVARYRAFVHTYVIDFNAKKAAIRLGFPDETAYDTGLIYLGNAFVQLLLSEIQKAAGLESVVTIGQVASKAWEEANRMDTVRDGCAMTNSSTRLAALNLLAKLLGAMNPKPAAPVGDELPRVMYVPVQMSADEWGRVAVSSQRKLKESTTIDI
jgi:hypothetical protein